MSSENSTTAVTNSTSRATEYDGTTPHLPQPWLATLYNNRGFIYTSARITASAMAIIWIGALSALRRPPSAAPPKDKKTRKDGKKDADDTFTEGFAASDAIMMPVLASVVLVGLYYLIKWMEDPDLLNKIIRGYMSIMSVASMGKFAADGLQLLTSLLFPDVWTDRAGKLYKIDGARRQHLLVNGDSRAEIVVSEKVTPFPGYFSGVKPPAKINNSLWTIRHLFMEEWTLKAALHGLGSANIKLKLKDMLGVNIAIITIVTYYITQWPYLSNVLGTAFCHMTFGLMSPTSFAIGSAVLFGLFVYDIVMVFYT
jgi:minor histocompatibility antigen H13